MKIRDRDVTAPRRHRKIAALLVAASLLVALSGVGIYGLITSPHDLDDAPSELAPPATSSQSPTRAPGATPSLPSIAASADPEVYARRVASALFTWDTASGLEPLDYTSVLLEVADSTGEEQAGLASDIATYLPSRDAWAQLRQYATSQTLTIDNVYIPDSWGDALAQAGDQLAEGTVAVTIDGTRHRAGVWNDEPVASEHPVAFTMFVVCEPSYDTCHLLRLSELDNPLR